MESDFETGSWSFWEFSRSSDQYVQVKILYFALVVIHPGRGLALFMTGTVVPVKSFILAFRIVLAPVQMAFSAYRGEVYISGLQVLQVLEE